MATPVTPDDEDAAAQRPQRQGGTLDLQLLLLSAATNAGRQSALAEPFPQVFESAYFWADSALYICRDALRPLEPPACLTNAATDCSQRASRRTITRHCAAASRSSPRCLPWPRRPVVGSRRSRRSSSAGLRASQRSPCPSRWSQALPRRTMPETEARRHPRSIPSDAPRWQTVPAAR